jgi:ribokinase
VTRPHIVVVGSTMIDMITYAERAPDAGETLIGERFVQGFGGKGANQAVLAARLGAAVTMATCVGIDALGDATVENLRREGIDVDHVTRTDRASSGVAPIWVERDGTNRIICVPGANHEMTQEQARTAVLATPEVDGVVGQLEVPQAVTAAGFRAAKERDAFTVLNPAPAGALDPGLVEVTDWLVPNEAELVELARSLGVSADGTPEHLAVTIARTTGTRVVVTLGSRGAAVCEDGQAPVHIAAPAVEAVDTTGAGDAFVGAFAYGLAAGKSATDAARLGCACASASVTRHGTQTSYPTTNEVAFLLQQLAEG